MKKSIFALVLTLLLASLWAGEALAQGKTPTDDDVNAVARQLFCPVCENTPLDVCPTEACKQWRELIRLKLSEGWSETQIKEYFVEQYGARVLAEPPRQGFSWLVYLVPPVLLAIGVYMVFTTLRAMRKPAPAASSAEETAPAPAVAEDDLRRVEEELKRLQ
ncbi:MAG: hypothetical protein OHK0031_19300 [Anaerolineales bacterium]